MHKLEHMMETAEKWVGQVADSLGCSPESAYLALRAGLHALRDRLVVDEAVQLGAQLPTLIRGIYYEGWTPHRVPIKVRHREDFFELIRRPFHEMDASVDPERISAAVFDLLSQRISEGEIDDVISTLPAAIKDLFFVEY